MSLLKSVADLWEADEALSALIPASRVWTGRCPQTELYRFPYVNVMNTRATVFQRSSMAGYAYVTVAFHIWCDDADLARGERVAIAIENAFCERCWEYADNRHVIDVLDEGPASVHQTDLPTHKAWEVVKLLTFVVERLRVEHNECCGSTGMELGSSEASN